MRAKLIKGHPAWGELKFGHVYEGVITDSGYFYIGDNCFGYKFDGYFEEVKDEKLRGVRVMDTLDKILITIITVALLASGVCVLDVFYKRSLIIPCELELPRNQSCVLIAVPEVK
tara:strand:- start:7372 stop:7716 length:345 start_codon:yes stop_codon:yes gene_type:complete